MPSHNQVSWRSYRDSFILIGAEIYDYVFWCPVLQMYELQMYEMIGGGGGGGKSLEGEYYYYY